MAQALRADAQRNRRRLLDAARALFTQDGVGASLDEVAAAAGVGPGTLYRHFPSRDRLVKALIEDGLGGIHDMGTDLLNEPDPVRALEIWLDAYIDQGTVFKGLAETLVAPPADGSGELDACHRAREAGAALIARAVQAGAFRRDLEAADVLDMVAAIAWVGEQQPHPAGQRGRLLRLLIDGMRVNDDAGPKSRPQRRERPA
jgi:AcrR family transcriptional regulator